MYANVCIVLASLSLVIMVASSKGAKRKFVRLQGGRGSGDDFDDEDEDNSEGSTGRMESECIKLQNRIKSDNIDGVYIPHCTPEGDFDPQQCTIDKKIRGECICINAEGQEMHGTGVLPQKKPNCTIIEKTKVTRFVSATTASSTRSTNKQEVTVGIRAKQDSHSKNDETEHIQGTSLQGRKSTSPSSEGLVYYQKSRPSLLAGIIVGTIFGLLCATLFVLFIIYRLRKRDEGSYALDEPKNSPAVAYTKAHDREFFA